MPRSSSGDCPQTDSTAGLEQPGHALNRLPDTLRQVIVLKDVYGLSHETIADETGISVAAAKVRLHRARKRLRDLLYDGIDPGRTQHAM